eukprot:1750473-Rhodomonas_salina.2
MTALTERGPGVEQAIIMFVAALTVSKSLTLEQGALIAIEMSVIQVAMAMPEQIWGIVCNFGAPDRDVHSLANRSRY